MSPNKTRVTSVLLWMAISLGATTVGVLIQSSSIGDFVEKRTYDLRFAFRGSLPPSPEAPTTVLAIDEETLAAIPDPLMLWHRHFAVVIEKLAQGGAAVVGIDFIFSDISRFDPVGQQLLSQALLRAGPGGLPVVLAYRITGYGTEQPPEAVRFAALAVGHSLAYVNLTTDSDDFVRSQEVAGASENGLQPSFPLAIASAFAGKTDRALPAEAESPGTILVNFRGPNHFDRIPFSAAVEAANRDDLGFFEENFGGRIVLIGRVGERGDEDFHSTPQCRVESGRADRPFHRPLNQTARAVFPQAAFLSCSSFGIRCVAAGGGFVRTAFGSFAKGTIQVHDISAFPIARTFTTEYGDFPLQRAFWTRQRRCSKQRSETLCLPSRS